MLPFTLNAIAVYQDVNTVLSHPNASWLHSLLVVDLFYGSLVC